MFFYLMLFVQVDMQGFIWPKNLGGGGNMGEVDVIGRLGGPRGWVREWDVPPLRKAREAKA